MSEATIERRQKRRERTREFFDALAPKRAGDARRHSAYYADRIRWLKQRIPSDASVVDVGCGTGVILRQLPQERKIGIDFAPEMIAIAKERDPHGRYVVDDALHLQSNDKTDYVLLLDTINYVTDVQVALEQIKTHLCHDRTRLIVTHYNFLWQPLFLLGELLGWKTKFPEQNWLSRADVRNLLDVSGFEVIEEESRLLFPLPIPGIADLCNRVLASLPFFRWFCLVRCVIARPRIRQRHEYSVTILSAVRNEKGNIAPIVENMPVLGTATELLFVEGHSSDGTWEEIERIQRSASGSVRIRGLQQPGKGKADALHHGIRESTGDILIIYDGDFTVHPSDLRKLYDLLADGHAEFVNGSRLVYPMEEGAMRVLNLIGNKMFSALFSWLFGQKIVDSLSPVKGFFRRDYPRMTSRADPFGDFDLFLGAAAQQLKMREAPVHYLERTYGTTKLSPFGHGWILTKLFFKGARELRWF